MAKRRCINIDFYDSEAFCELPPRVKYLYTELILHSDDDGVVINPKAVLRICKSDKRNLDLLVNKKFLLNIDGVYIIRHWYVHNKVQPSRKIDSIYSETLYKLYINERNEYCAYADNLLTDCQPNITKLNQTEINSNEMKSNEVNISKASQEDADKNHFISSPEDYDGIAKAIDRHFELRRQIIGEEI